MKRSLIFFKRNLMEILRDPVLYIFCLAFPILMVMLFAIIGEAIPQEGVNMFKMIPLVPGMVMFSFSLLMLAMSLLISKDRVSSLLRRLYASPMKTHEFIVGYALVGLIIGLGQSLISILAGWVVALITGQPYFGFLESLLLVASQLPMLIIAIFTGILLGSGLTENAAPGVSSVFVSVSGVLGGAWMPLETMAGFETFCRFLPFYPSVYLGRIAVGATHLSGEAYVFDSVAGLGLIPLLGTLVLVVVFSLVVFGKQKKRA